MQQVEILNILISNITQAELLSKLKDGGIVFTPNVDHLMKLQKDQDFQRIYNFADYRICDSQIIIYVSRFLGTPIKEKICGSDLFPAFYQYYKHDDQIKIFLLGGPDQEIANVARSKINQKVNREMVIGCYSPPFGFENDPVECDKIIDLINNSGATVLAVGVGAPKQEKWIFKHKPKLTNIKIFFAIGATIEFEAEYRHRAPEWMSKIGLEWFYRLLLEPKRLAKRYLVEDIPFFWLVLLQKIRSLKPVN